MMLSDVSVEEILQESVRKEDIAKDLRLPKHQLPSKDDLESRIDDRISISSSSSSPSSVSLSLLSHCQREEEDGFSPPLQRGEGRGEKEEEGPSKKRREETPRPSLDERGQAAIDQEEERRELGEREKMNAAIFSSSNGEVQRQEHRSEDFKKKKEEDEKKKEEDEKKKKKMCLELDDHMREGRGSPIEKEEQDDCLDEQDMYVDKRGRRRRSEERKEEEKETRISVGLENKKTRALKQCKIDSFFKHPQKSTGEKDKIPFSNLLELSTRGGEEDKAKKSKKEDESDKEREREVASPSLFPSLTPVEGENKEQEEEKKSEEDCASRGLEQDPDTTEVSRVKQGDLHPSDTIENVQNSNKRIHHTGRCETPSLSSSSLRVGAEREDECILAVEDEPERICKKQKTSFSSFSFSALKVVGKGDVQNLSCLASPDGELLPIVDAEERWKSILGHSWYEALREELRKPYMEKCLRFVRSERQKSRVYPPPSLVFNAFKHTPLNEVKVVILGQDPYHQPHQAMGLAFSVPRGVSLPPSLQNIFKEVDRNYPHTKLVDKKTNRLATGLHGDLTSWARQGVFLLNTLLTVRESSPLSHQHSGWETFTSRVIEIINERCEGVVFLLWGKPAQKKSMKVNRHRHRVLEAGHPSPLSVRFFQGCEHFRKCNGLLKALGKKEISFSIDF